MSKPAIIVMVVVLVVVLGVVFKYLGDKGDLVCSAMYYKFLCYFIMVTENAAFSGGGGRDRRGRGDPVPAKKGPIGSSSERVLGMHQIKSSNLCRSVHLSSY